LPKNKEKTRVPKDLLQAHRSGGVHIPSNTQGRAQQAGRERRSSGTRFGTSAGESHKGDQEMPKLTPQKLILIAGIAALAFAAMPIRHAGSTVAMKQMHERIFEPTTTTPVCRFVQRRICRPVRGRESTYLAQTPVAAAIRVSSLAAEAM